MLAICKNAHVTLPAMSTQAPSHRPILPRIATLAMPLLVLASAVPLCAHGTDDKTLSARVNEARSRFATLNQAKSELQRDLRKHSLTTREEADFRDWIDSLEQSLAQQCQSIPVPQRPAEACSDTVKNTVSVNTDDEQTETEVSDALDAELNKSLSAFDQMLLNEQKSVAAQANSGGGSAPASDNTDDSGQGKQDGGGSPSGTGSNPASAPSQERGAVPNPTSRQASRQSGEATSHDPGQPARWSEVNDTVGQRDPQGHSSPPASNQDWKDGKDDDVVARQIREAAEKEQDPKLRKKLWEEYRRYKQGL